MVVLLFSCKKEIIEAPTSGIDESITVIQDELENEKIVLVGSEGRNFIVSFFRTLSDGTELTFEVNPELPVVMIDNEGTKWDAFGYGIEGPRAGQRLQPTRGYNGFWFSWASMYQGIEIYEGTPSTWQLEETPSTGWTISTEFVAIGAGIDAIQAIDNPAIIDFNVKDNFQNDFYVQDEDLIIGVRVGDEYIAYPHAILNWHEIINAQIANKYFSVIYCPLTGTGTVWDRKIDGQVTTFGVSGLLYNNNIIPYDRWTASNWTQMKQHCVNGSLIGTEAETFSVVETTWRTWKQMYNQPRIVDPSTGYGRDYSIHPYEGYETNHDLINYPLAYDDDRLQRKERVHGVVINGKARAYRFSSF